MRLALAIATPEVVTPPPVALLSGDFRERLEKAKRLGYSGVELMTARPAALDNRVLLEELNQAGLQAVAIASGPVYMQDGFTLLARSDENSQKAIDRLESMIELANLIGAPLVTIGSFRGRLAWAGGQTARDNLKDILKWACGIAAVFGIKLALEPLNRYETDFIRTAAEGLIFLEEVGSENLGLLLDTFHMNIEEVDMVTTIYKVYSAGKLFHLHLGDSNRLPPGKGHIDFAVLVRILRAIGYAGYLSAELFPQPDPDVAALQTITHMQQWLKDKSAMTGLVVFVHTVQPLIGVFNRLAAEIIPGVDIKHILDEPLLEAVQQQRGLDAGNIDRLRTHATLAESIGADAVLVTCSTISPLVEPLRHQFSIPLFAIDEVMADHAIRSGPRIGVLATNPTTSEPTRKMLLDKAQKAGIQIELKMVVVPNALKAVLSGDGATHDRLLTAAIADIYPDVDLIVLAQASMARVLDVLSPELLTKPVYSSPHLALEKLRIYIDTITPKPKL